MTFILNQYEIEDAEIQAAHDFHRPNTQEAVLTLARLMEYANENSDGWAYWRKPSNASTKLQKLVEARYANHRNADTDTDITRAELRAAYSPIRAFLTREKIEYALIFPND
jgi:hypothetical protein